MWLIIPICIFLGLIITIIILSVMLAGQKTATKDAQLKAQEDIAKAQTACNKKIQHLIAKHDSEIEELNKKHAKELQKTKEQIEGRKDVLSKLSDKDLLVSVMVALEGYGSRFERIERFLTEDTMTEKYTALFNQLSGNINETKDNLSGLIAGMNSKIEKEIHSSSIMEKLDAISSDIENIPDYSWQLSNISNTADNIESTAYDIQNTVDDVQGTVDYTQGTVNDIQITVNRIDCSSNDNNFDSIANQVSSISSELEDIKRTVENAHEAAERAQSSAEEARDAAQAGNAE